MQTFSLKQHFQYLHFQIPTNLIFSAVQHLSYVDHKIHSELHRPTGKHLQHLVIVVEVFRDFIQCLRTVVS